MNGSPGHVLVTGAGGFVGGSTGSKIARTYCSGRVSTSASGNVGAFGGSLPENVVTNSYYDSDATALLAAGRTGAEAVDYAGIDPAPSAAMTTRETFVAFDFAETWQIDNETMPYLLYPYEFATADYITWLVFSAGLPKDTPPEEMVNGIPAVARYLFDILPDSMTNDEGDPVLQIHFAADGSPWLSFPTVKNPNQLGARFHIVSSPEVSDWSDATAVVSPEIDMSEGVYAPDFDPVPEKMFFKYRIVLP